MVHSFYQWPWATTNFRPYLHVLINSLKWNPLLFQQRNAFWRKTVDRMASLSSGNLCNVEFNLQTPIFLKGKWFLWDCLLYSKVKMKTFFFPPFSSLFNRTKFTDGSLRALENSECAWSTMGTDPGFKKKKARKMYLKQLQINLRKHHLVYNQGCGEEKNLHKWFHFQMWCINGTKDDSQRNQHHENKSAKTERNVLFLGLEPKIFFSLVTILTSKAEARNVNPYGAPLAADSVSILTQRRGKAAHCVSPPREKRKGKKKNTTCF